jgi:hypothetical protein
MLDLDKVYSEKFFKGRQWLMGRSREMTKHLAFMYDTPQPTLDVGAGIADFSAAWLELDVDAYALEGTENCVDDLMIPYDRLIIADLRFPVEIPIDMPQKYELVTSFEVAEHIEEAYVPQFIANLHSFTDSEGIVAMSICTKKGRYHYTVQELPWWLSHFKAGGFRHTGDEELFRELAGRPYIDKGGWDHRAGNLRMLGDNMVIFQRTT